MAGLTAELESQEDVVGTLSETDEPAPVGELDVSETIVGVLSEVPA